MKNIFISFLLSTVLVSCAVSPQGSSADSNLTVGTVQKEIRLGMSSVDVLKALGSPNIVQTDENRNEVWVYDKLSTHVSSSSGRAGVWLLSVVSGGLFGASGSSSSSSSSQRTLTIIIKMDKNSKVKDFSYHSSRF